MKKLILIIGIIVTSFINSFAQDIDLSYNKAYDGLYTSRQNFEAEALLYKEINYYRELNGLDPVTISERVAGYACRWGNYMVSKHKTPYDNFYQHSKMGPDSLMIPSNCSEIIHLLYYDHKPSCVEIVAGLMYGISRPPNKSVVGWTQSPSHNEALLQNIVKFYGASIYVFKTTNGWWTVFGVVNFSTIK